jgi:hypothetical protein
VNTATSESIGKNMQLTISNAKPGWQRNRFSSKYAPIYCAIDQALKDGREIVLGDFDSFTDALGVYKCIRRYYSKVAYIGFSKYSEFKKASPKVTVSPRGNS